MESTMFRHIIRAGAITIILLTLSSLAVADDSSFVMRLFNWLKSNVSVFRQKEQGAESIEHGAKGEERSTKSKDQDSIIVKPASSIQHPVSSIQYPASRTAKLLRFYNYPNPFIPELGTDFICELDGEANLELKIFSMDGSLVRKLDWASPKSPPHWDGKDNISRTVRTGMYIYLLRVTDVITGEVTDTRYGKMMAWYMR
jgi:hypothetical protein